MCLWFLMQAMPQPDSAMFYFKTNKLGFDAEFFGRVKLVAALADLGGGAACWAGGGEAETGRVGPTARGGGVPDVC
jgi:hypothetical protein